MKINFSKKYNDIKYMNDGSKLAPPAKKRYASSSGEVITANDETFFNVPSRMVLHTPNYSDSVITEIPAHNRFIPVRV